MTQPANGRAAANTLVTVQGAMQLETATAAAYLRAKAAGGLTIAAPLGAYRSYAEQAALKANPAAYGSSLKSSQIAGPGNSTHGYGTCVDIAAGNAWFQTHCGAYGFVRESPAGENNHYRYTAPTWAAASAPAAPVATNLTQDEVRRVATYLNGRGLGFTTTAATTGINMLPGATASNYYKEVQTAGNRDGLYPTPAYKINGIPGPKTYEVEEHYRDLTAPVVAPPVVVPDPPVVVPDPPVETPPVETTPPVDTTPVESDPVVTTPPVDTTPVTTDPVVTPPATTDPVSTTPVTEPSKPVIPTKPVTPAKPAQKTVLSTILEAIAAFFKNFGKKS